MLERLSRNAVFLAASSLALALLITSCGGGSSNPPVPVSKPGFSTNSITITFGNQAVGTTSAAQVATLTNVGNATLTISSIQVTGPNASDYTLTNTCGSSLAPSAQCTLSVTFTPGAAGTRTASVVFTDNATGSPQTVSLTGTCIAPSVSLSATSVSFGNQPVGTTSAASAVTVTNNGAAALTFTSIAATGDFAVAASGTTCSTSAPVAPSGNCVINVTFTPTATGSRSGSLTLTDNASGSPQTMSLTGTGTAPSVSLSTTSVSFSNQAVGTTSAASPVTVTNTGTVSLTFTSIAAAGDFAVAASGTTCSTTAPVAASGSCVINVGFTPTATGSRSGSLTLTDNASGSPQTVGLDGNGTAGFVLTGSLNTARYYYTATLLNNGLVLIAGGLGSSAVLASAELYNPATGTFTPTGSLNTARFSHTATLLNNGMVLIAGGSGGGQGVAADLTSAELYNPATGTFTPTGSLNAGRAVHTATLLNNGMVLIAGGNLPPLASAELYNPTTGAFTPTGSLNYARVEHTATLLNNGMVLIAGGQGVVPIPGGQSFPGLASAELYNPATGTFTATGSLNGARFQHSATLLNNGMVLIGGGQDQNSAYLASAELYNPTTGAFTGTGSLNYALVGHTATLLNNGMVLIAGGTFGAISAELYDPATGTFTATGILNVARVVHKATLLDNGIVLVAAGFGEVGVISSAELYEPDTLTPPNLESIAITPATSTLSLGATQQFVATGTFSDGSTLQLASVTWSSSDPTVAQMTNDASNHGVGLAIAAGTVTITASAGSVSGSATLTVQ